MQLFFFFLSICAEQTVYCPRFLSSWLQVATNGVITLENSLVADGGRDGSNQRATVLQKQQMLLEFQRISDSHDLLL